MGKGKESGRNKDGGSRTKEMVDHENKEPFW